MISEFRKTGRAARSIPRPLGRGGRAQFDLPKGALLWPATPFLQEHMSKAHMGNMDRSNMARNNILAHRDPSSQAHNSPHREMSARNHDGPFQWPQSRDRKQT